MKLPGFIDKIFNKKEKEIEYFLSLLFNEKKVKAVIWKREELRNEIVGTAERETNENWEEIIVDSDSVITQAAPQIPQEKVKKLIFGLPINWIEENKIKEPHLTALKKLATDLSLTPIGFIVISEAIIHFLSQQEGAPATVILLGFDKEKFSLTISRVGKIVKTVEKDRKEGVALCETVAKTLKEDFSQVEVLPSKILLFDGLEDLETIKQELIAYPWLSKAEFLHFPKIEALPKDFDLKAMVFSAASEMGIDAGIQEKPAFILEEAKAQRDKEENLKKSKIEETFPPETDNFGFVKDSDIAKESPPVMPDLTLFKEEQQAEVRKQPFLEKDQEVVPGKEESKKFKLPNFRLPSLLKLNFIFHLPVRFKSKGVILGLILLVLITGLTLAYWYIPKAQIVLLVSPRVLEKEEEIIIDPKITVLTFSKKRLPGTEVTIEEKGQKKNKVTGKKIIGEKAKGEVTIFNKTDYPKTFKVGTELTGSKDLKFTLNSEVTVASQSSTTSSNEQTILNPGRAKVKVTASQIGAESNFNSSTEFKIEDFSIETYKAKNEDDAFSGGLSREVAVVSQSDQAKLLENLTKGLTLQAKKDLLTKVSDQQSLIEKTMETTVINKKFSQDVGEETEEISLDLSLKFKAIVYSTNDLNNLIFQIVDKTTPSGYQYQKEKIGKEIKEVRVEKDKSVALKIYFKTSLFPKIDQEKIKKEIMGKKPKAVSQYLSSLPNVVGYEIKISPKLPGFLYTFPKVSKNISIEIKKK